MIVILHNLRTQIAKNQAWVVLLKGHQTDKPKKFLAMKLKKSLATICFWKLI